MDFEIITHTDFSSKKLIRSSISKNDVMALNEIRKIYYNRLSLRYKTILFLSIQVPFIFQFS
jgi:hypothetical protein